MQVLTLALLFLNCMSLKNSHNLCFLICNIRRNYIISKAFSVLKCVILSESNHTFWLRVPNHQQNKLQRQLAGVRGTVSGHRSAEN